MTNATNTHKSKMGLNCIQWYKEILKINEYTAIWLLVNTVSSTNTVQVRSNKIILDYAIVHLDICDKTYNADALTAFKT